MSFLKLTIIYIILNLFSSVFLISLEKYVDFELIKKVETPKLLDKGILFTLPKTEAGETAFLRTSIDNWEKNYYYKEGLYGILYAFIQYPINYIHENKKIQYRININGEWQPDQNNPCYAEDTLGTQISTLEIPKEINYHFKTPIIENTENKVKTVQFRYYNPQANEVNLICSIDNWCNFSHAMLKNSDGFWETTQEFTKGKYLYMFLIDGKEIPDIDNSNRLWDDTKGLVSYFVIE